MAAPLEWQLIPDQEHGSYFFNRTTGLSTWEAPPGLNQPASPESAVVAVIRGATGEEFEAIANTLVYAVDIHVIAQSLASFFKQLFKTKQRTWARKLGIHVAFPVCTRDVVCRAFMYGERSPAMTKIARRAPRMQAWMKWILPLFDRLDSAEEDPLPDAGAAPPAMTNKPPRGSNPVAKLRLVDLQATLLVMSMLHYSFRVEPPERFGLMLTEVQRRFESQGWNEVNCENMGGIFKALLKKITRVDAATLKKDYEHPTWDKLLVLSSAAEEFVFLSPLFGHEVRPDPSVVGIHLSERGCSDKELIANFHELVNGQLGVGNQAIASEVFQDQQAAKEYKKRKELLAGMGQFWSAANKWCESLEKLVLNPESNQARAGKYAVPERLETKMDPMISEMCELLSKRVSRCKKKQATQALQLAVGACKYYVRSYSGTEPRPKSLGSNEMPSWDSLSHKAVMDQTLAGCFHLKRLIHSLESVIEAYNAFTSKVDSVIPAEAKKCYFVPNYMGLQNGLVEGVPKDGMPAFVEASATVINLTNLAAIGARAFVQEMQAEILNPLNELKAEYDEAVNTFKMHCAQVEKDFDRERELLIKDHATCERDFMLVNLSIHESQKMFDPKAEQKRLLMAQRTVARFVRYEQLHAHYDQHTIPTTVSALRVLISTMQLVELKRVMCTQVCLNRFLESFARFAGDQSPMFRTCVNMVEALNPLLEMECFSMKAASASPLPSLPKLPLSASAFLDKLALEDGDKMPEQPAAVSPGVCSCGTPIDFDFQFCIECGARATSVPRPEALKAESSDGSKAILARMKPPMNVSAIQGKLKSAPTLPVVGKSLKSPERVTTLEKPLKPPPALDLRASESDGKAIKGPSTPSPTGSPQSDETTQAKAQIIAALAVQQKMKARLEALEKAEAAKAAASTQSRSDPNAASVASPGHTRSESNTSDNSGSSPTNETHMVSDLRCPSCNSAVYSDSRFCVECGSPVVPAEKKASLRPAAPPPPSRKFASG